MLLTVKTVAAQILGHGETVTLSRDGSGNYMYLIIHLIQQIICYLSQIIFYLPNIVLETALKMEWPKYYRHFKLLPALCIEEIAHQEASTLSIKYIQISDSKLRTFCIGIMEKYNVDNKGN